MPPDNSATVAPGTDVSFPQNADWRPALLWRREKDSFLIFAQHFGFGFM
jgi:hypothetical protein